MRQRRILTIRGFTANPWRGPLVAARRPEKTRDDTPLYCFIAVGSGANERRRRTAGVRYSNNKRAERRSFPGGYAPRPPWLALRARYLTRCAKRHLTESDYAQSAKFFLAALRYEFRRNDEIVPPTRPVSPPEDTSQPTTNGEFSFFVVKKNFGSHNFFVKKINKKKF